MGYYSSIPGEKCKHAYTRAPKHGIDEVEESQAKACDVGLRSHASDCGAYSSQCMIRGRWIKRCGHLMVANASTTCKAGGTQVAGDIHRDGETYECHRHGADVMSRILRQQQGCPMLRDVHTV